MIGNSERRALKKSISKLGEVQMWKIKSRQKQSLRWGVGTCETGLWVLCSCAD